MSSVSSSRALLRAPGEGLVRGPGVGDREPGLLDVPDERLRPPPPRRGSPRQSDETLRRWAAAGRSDLLLQELLTEEDYADEAVRRGWR